MIQKNNYPRTSLVVQWLILHLPAQGLQVRSLVGELNPHISWPENIQQKQYYNKFKTLKEKWYTPKTLKERMTIQVT